MRRALLTIGVVTGCSLLETALLLIYLLPEELPYSGLRHSVLGFAQFLTLPAIAALFSFILYGCYQWKRRVALYFVTVPGFLGVMLLAALPSALLEQALERRGLDPGESVLFATATVVSQVVMLAAVSVLLFFMAAKGRKRSVELESSRWLAERQAGIGPRERQ